MRDGGKTTKQMAREDLFMLMVISMMASGKMTRPMDSASIAISTVLDMKDTGKKTSSMETASRHGLMALAITETM
jgi:hypothetical protein